MHVLTLFIMTAGIEQHVCILLTTGCTTPLHLCQHGMSGTQHAGWGQPSLSFLMVSSSIAPPTGEGRSLPRFDDEAEWQEEKERQAQELIRAHPKHHRYLEGSGPTLTPVLEEEIGNNVGESPLPPLPVVSPEMSAVLEARSSVKELQELEEMMGKESVTPSLSSASETSPVPLVAEKQEAAPSPPLSSPLPTTTQSPDGHQVSSVVRRGDVDVGGGEEGGGEGGAVGDTGSTEIGRAHV